MSRHRLLCVEGSLESAEVERLWPSSRIGSRLYYPYYAFRTNVRRRAVTYLLDGRTGQLATSDPFLLEEVRAPGRDVLPPKLDGPTASRRGRRYVPGRLLAEWGLIHKAFFVVEMEEGRYLLDATSARLHPLPLLATPPRERLLQY